MSEDRHLQFLAKIEAAKRKREEEAARSESLASNTTAEQPEQQVHLQAVEGQIAPDEADARIEYPEVEESMVVEVAPTPESDLNAQDVKEGSPDKGALPIEDEQEDGASQVDVSGSADRTEYYKAIWEAARCLYCYEPPCVKFCPVNIDIPEVIRRLARNDADSAAHLLLEKNPAGNLCGRVCPTELLCERACVLHQSGRRPISIRTLEKYISSQDVYTQLMQRQVEQQKKRVLTAKKNVAVVGAGPAGFACAIELIKNGYDVTVFEQNQRPGGLATHAIPSVKISIEDATTEAQLINDIGINIQYGVRVGHEIAPEQLLQQYDAIFLGVGLNEPLLLGIEGEQQERVIDGLSMIIAQRQNRKLPFRISEQIVVVVGGGNVAMYSAMLAMEMGARQAVAVSRRTMSEMPADPEVVRMVRQMGVMLIFEHEPVSVHGNGTVKALECRLTRSELGGGKEEKAGRNLVLPCQVLVRCIGYRVSSMWSKWFDGLKIEGGVIAVDPETGMTGNNKVFAGGDCTNGGRRVVYAVQEGQKIAAAIHRHLSGGGI